MKTISGSSRWNLNTHPAGPLTHSLNPLFGKPSPTKGALLVTIFIGRLVMMASQRSGLICGSSLNWYWYILPFATKTRFLTCVSSLLTNGSWDLLKAQPSYPIYVFPFWGTSLLPQLVLQINHYGPSLQMENSQSNQVTFCSKAIILEITHSALHKMSFGPGQDLLDNNVSKKLCLEASPPNCPQITSYTIATSLFTQNALTANSFLSKLLIIYSSGVSPTLRECKFLRGISTNQFDQLTSIVSHLSS